jgi:hypothetical protein
MLIWVTLCAQMYLFQANKKIVPAGWSLRPGRSGWVMLALTAALYAWVFERRVLCDITAQMHTLCAVCAGAVDLPPTALFYGMSWLGALGQCRFPWLMGGALLALTGLLYLRFVATRAILEDYFATTDTAEKERWGWLALALAWVASWPSVDWWQRGWYMFGQVSPNYWMNGTLIASWPWAVWLFWCSYRQLQAPQAGWWKEQLVLTGLLLLSKPSYLLVYLPLYPVFLLARHGWRRATAWHVLPILGIFLVLLVEYYLVFCHPDSVYVKDFNQGENSGVVFSWATVWRLHTANIPLAVLSSLAFPLLTAFLYFSELRHRLLFWYAWSGMGVAMLLALSFMQTGAEYYNWSFRFQLYIAAYILFLVSAIWLWEQVQRQRGHWSWREMVAVLAAAMHLIAGLGYWCHWWWTRGHQ